MKKRLISSLLIAVCIATTIPVSALAEWKNDNNGWWYTEGESYSTGWKQIDGKWYYFNSDGYMKTGWVQESSNWYYLDNNGVMLTGKTTVNGKVYTFDSNGKWIDTTNSSDTVSNNLSTSVKPSTEKLKSVNDYSWFEENGNTYFKIDNREEGYTVGVWNIDNNMYVFDKNGVMIRGEYTAEDGVKYLFGQDGKYIKCLTSENIRLYTGWGMTTKSATTNKQVKLYDYDDYPMSIVDVYSSDSEKNGVRIEGTRGSILDKTQAKATVEGKTLKCRTNQTITLSVIQAQSIDNKVKVPNLLVQPKSTNEDIAFLAIDDFLVQDDGYMVSFTPYIITKKTGTTTITIDVNGTITSFDVVVTD